nr:hypothetical protein Iba_scaffold137CG0550 [Ipomoea batatas]
MELWVSVGSLFLSLLSLSKLFLKSDRFSVFSYYYCDRVRAFDYVAQTN